MPLAKPELGAVGKAGKWPRPASQETYQARLKREIPSGVTVRRPKMTTLSQSRSPSQNPSRARLLAALVAATLGLALITLTGHVQASALHDAAHDMRHATGFPCH